jgi:hypothetical protein
VTSSYPYNQNVILLCTHLLSLSMSLSVVVWLFVVCHQCSGRLTLLPLCTPAQLCEGVRAQYRMLYSSRCCRVRLRCRVMMCYLCGCHSLFVLLGASSLSVFVFVSSPCLVSCMWLGLPWVRSVLLLSYSANIVWVYCNEIPFECQNSSKSHWQNNIERT